MRGVDAVIHLAGLPGVRTRRAGSALHEANVAAHRAPRAGRERGGVRFVLVSSSSVYGNARVLPTPEHAPPAPLNPYAASKVAAEAAVREHGSDAVIVRPFTVYGPGQRPEMAFARWIDCLAAPASRCRGTRRPAPRATSPTSTTPWPASSPRCAAAARARRTTCRAGARWSCARRSRCWRTAFGCGRLRSRPAELGAEARVTSGCGRKAAAELGYEPRDGPRHRHRRQLAAAGSGRLAA